MLPASASWAEKAEQKDEIRVVVKSDDGSDKVVDATDAASTLGLVTVVDDTDGESAALVLRGLSTLAAPADDKTAVSITLATDGTTYSVSADSVDDAIKKLNEQVELLKAKAPLGEKDKAAARGLAADRQAANRNGAVGKVGLGRCWDR